MANLTLPLTRNIAKSEGPVRRAFWNGKLTPYTVVREFDGYRILDERDGPPARRLGWHKTLDDCRADISGKLTGGA